MRHNLITAIEYSIRFHIVTGCEYTYITNITKIFIVPILGLVSCVYPLVLARYY